MKKNLVVAVTVLTLIISGCSQKKTIKATDGSKKHNSLRSHNGRTGSSTISSIGNGGVSSSSGYKNVDPYGSKNRTGRLGASGTGGKYGNRTGSKYGTRTGKYGNSSSNSNGGYANSRIKKIYFDINRYAITADKVPTIIYNANLLKSDISKGAQLKIEGHCDASGTDEYNYALGLRRAKSAKDEMVKRGIPSESMTIVSMGESSPECTIGTSSRCYSKNRRVEFKVVQ